MKIDDRHRVAARELANGASRTAAAEAAGVSRQALTKWLPSPEFQALLSSFEKPSGPDDSESAQATADYLAHQLDETHRDIESARDAQSWQAVASLRKRAEECRKALDAARPPAATLEDMSEEEFVAGLRRAMEQWPDQYHELSAEIYADRYRRVR